MAYFTRNIEENMTFRFLGAGALSELREFSDISSIASEVGGKAIFRLSDDAMEQVKRGKWRVTVALRPKLSMAFLEMCPKNVK